jgi:hypothetical protein
MTPIRDAPLIAVEYEEISVEIAALLKRHFDANDWGTGEQEILARVTDGWGRSFDAKQTTEYVAARLQALDSGHSCGRCLGVKVVPGWAAHSRFSARLYLGSHTRFATKCLCAKESTDVLLEAATGNSCGLCSGHGIVPDWIHYLFHPKESENVWRANEYECRSIEWIQAESFLEEHDQNPFSNRGPNPGTDEFMRDLIEAWLPKICPSCAGWGVGNRQFAMHKNSMTKLYSHSPDFLSVNWFGTPYTFRPNQQAAVVRVLWEEFDAGGHGLGKQTIKDRIESRAEDYRVRSSFKTSKGTHEAFGTMIQEIRPGVFALVRPSIEKK